MDQKRQTPGRRSAGSGDTAILWPGVGDLLQNDGRNVGRERPTGSGDVSSDETEVTEGRGSVGDGGAVAPRLRPVHVGGAGCDGIDFAALPAGAACADTFRHESSIAEYVVATSVRVRRGLLFQDRGLRTGHWASSVWERERPQPSTLEGATVGIVGYGHVGAATRRLMRAFGARGVAVSRRPCAAAAEGLAWAGGWEDLDRLLAESDVVVLCLPLPAVMSVLVFLDVVLRYGFNSDIVATAEPSRHLFVWLTFLSGISAFARNRQVQVDMVREALPVRGRLVLGVIGDVAMLVCCVMIAVGCWVFSALDLEDLLPVTGIPVAALDFAGIPFAVACGVMLLIRLVRRIRALLDGGVRS
jgi:TRAP-type C4-dicarboxylate transport system permease small subunit